MYPQVIDEFKTIDALLEGRSIARFGDGEIKLINGGNCVSQKANTLIAAELSDILLKPQAACLTGIPNIEGGKSPKDWFWNKYHTSKKLTDLYNPHKQYHSSFITRPDSAPWIDTPQYWQKVVKLWAGKRVLLITGGRSSALRVDTMPEAESIIEMRGPETDAYSFIDKMEEEAIHLRGTYNTAILCLGPTATCLANRLARAGIHALDLGHIAIYYRRHLKGEPMDKKHG